MKVTGGSQDLPTKHYIMIAYTSWCCNFTVYALEEEYAKIQIAITIGFISNMLKFTGQAKKHGYVQFGQKTFNVTTERGSR